MDWTTGFLTIVGAIVIAGLFYKFDKGQSFIDKLFRGVVFLGCFVAVIIGITFIVDDASSDIGDGRDTYYERDYDNSDEESSGEVSFRGRGKIADYNYGACNSGCGCKQYAHYPGRTECANCEENGCSTYKFGHEER